MHTPIIDPAMLAILCGIFPGREIVFVSEHQHPVLRSQVISESIYFEGCGANNV